MWSLSMRRCERCFRFALSAVFAAAWFLYSGDGGRTWSQSVPPMRNYLPMGLSIVDPTHAFAAMINAATQQSAIAAYE